jgi:hypothetical protein
MKLRRRPRRGMAAFDAVLCAGALLPIAGAIYWLLEEAMEMYSLTLGTAVGWPLM